jgi:RNA-binding protein NOB1
MNGTSSSAYPAPSTKGAAAPTTVPKAPSVNPWKVAQPVQPTQTEEAQEEEEEDAFPSLQSIASKDVDVTEKMNSMSITEERNSGAADAVAERKEEEPASTATAAEQEQSEPLRTNKREQVYASEDDDDAFSSTNGDQDDSDSENDAEWITPENVVTHKAQDLGLAPAADTNFTTEGVFQPSGKTRKDRGRKNKKPVPQHVGKPLDVACMTGDYAVQNVLMQIGLNLVGSGGKKIAQVKSWVLRCHACFK